MAGACRSTKRQNTCFQSGGGEIRTHGTLAGPPVFKTGAFDHSATPPGCALILSKGRDWSKQSLTRSLDQCRDCRKLSPARMGLARTGRFAVTMGAKAPAIERGP